MNQRLASGVLAGLSVTLIAVEILVAVFGGFDLRWMVLFLSIYAGLVGLLFGLRTLADGSREAIESVSERRARARRDSSMGGILDDYDIDEEFVGRSRGWHKPVFIKPSGSSSSADQKGQVPDDEELKSALMAYAGMAGGLVTLRETIEAMDETAFSSMARKAGMAGVSRTRALSVVVELVSAENTAKSSDGPALSLSIDKESFDDYISRCMSDTETCADEEESEGFSVGLDTGGFSSMPGTPPTDFSHDPKSVMSRLNRKGRAE
jgi:hypothetical protein